MSFKNLLREALRPCGGMVPVSDAIDIAEPSSLPVNFTAPSDGFLAFSICCSAYYITADSTTQLCEDRYASSVNQGATVPVRRGMSLRLQALNFTSGTRWTVRFYPLKNA